MMNTVYPQITVLRAGFRYESTFMIFVPLSQIVRVGRGVVFGADEDLMMEDEMEAGKAS